MHPGSWALTWAVAHLAGLHFTYPKDKRFALYKHAKLTGEEKEAPSPAPPGAHSGSGGDGEEMDVVVLESRSLLQGGRRSPIAVDP
jgi:hypothetical protein